MTIEIKGFGTLTDEHPASSYGIPVLVINGRAYGPDDIVATGQVTGTGITAAQVANPVALCGYDVDEAHLAFARKFMRASSFWRTQIAGQR